LGRPKMATKPDLNVIVTSIMFKIANPKS